MTPIALSGWGARYHACAAVILMTLGLAAIPLRTQTISGDIVGAVLDPTGAAISGAKVESVNVDTGVKNDTTSNAQGEYRFGNLLIGTYKISATANGFAPSTLDNV